MDDRQSPGCCSANPSRSENRIVVLKRVRSMVAFPEQNILEWHKLASQALANWELSLDDLEEILILGQWEKLQDFATLYRLPHAELAEVEIARKQILELAKDLGLPSTSLVRLVDYLGLDGGPRQFLQLQQRFRLAHRRMTAALTHIRLCDDATQTLLRLIATGEKDGATYIVNERHHLEGGILVDEQA